MDDAIATDAHRKRRRRLLSLVLIGIVLIDGMIGAFQPWTANHFGYALPGTGHLLFRVTYGERNYSNQWQCVGADWCQQHVGQAIALARSHAPAQPRSARQRANYANAINIP